MFIATKYTRLLRRAIWYSIAAFIIGIAVVVSILRIFLPDLTGYRTELEDVASAFLEHPVHISSMDARLVGFTPTVIFRDVRMMDQQDENELVRFSEARLGIAIIDSIRNRRVIPSDFTINGIDLAVTRRKDGRFLVQGIDVGKFDQSFAAENTRGANELAGWLFGRTRLALRDTTLVWKDLKQDGKVLQFDDVNIELRNDNRRHQLNGVVTLPREMGKRFEIALDVTGDVLDPRKMQGRIYVRGDAVNLDKWGVKPQYLDVTLNTGIADFQLWGEWKDAALQKLTGDTTLYNVNLSVPVMDKPYQLKLMGALFDLERKERGWRLNVDRFQYAGATDIWPETRFHIDYQTADDQQSVGWNIQTEYFRIEDVTRLLLQTNLLDAKQRKLLETVQPTGDVRWLRFRQKPVDDEADYQLQADFAGLSARPWQAFPGVTGLSGRAWSDMQRGYVTFDASEAALEMPRLFRWPLQLTQLNGRLEWLRQDDGLKIWTHQLVARNSEVKTSTSLQLDIPLQEKISPYLDLQVRFEDGKAEFAKHYYPVGIMGKEVVDWLDNGIVSGQIEQGGVIYNGRLRDFPFASGDGRFLVEFDAQDVVLDYQAGWPRLTRAGLAAKFTGQGMQIVMPHANLFESDVRNGRVSIDNFKQPVLSFSGQVDGGLRDTTRFLTQSPVAPAARNFFNSATVSGQTSTRFEARIPLSKRAAKAAPLRYAGQVSINDGKLLLLAGNVDITEINGEVTFNQERQEAKGIRARVLGGPASFDLISKHSAANNQFSILASGEVDVAGVVSRFAVPGHQRVTGSSGWHGAVILNTNEAQHAAPLIRLVSNLQDVAIDLPEPLYKEAGTDRPLTFEARFKDEQHTELSITYDKAVSARLDLRSAGNSTRLGRAHVHLAEGEAVLPSQPLIKVTGSLAALRPGEWTEALLTQDKATADDKPVTDLPIEIELDSVKWLPKQSEPAPAETERETVSQPPPRGIAGITGTVKSLYYGDYDLGRAEFEITESEQGLHLPRLALQGGNLQFNATGDWLYRRGRHYSKLDFQVSSPDMGKLLDSLDYSAIIQGGELNAEGSLDWQSAPTDLDYESLKGTIDLRVSNGSIVKVQPGAGRLIGLFSLSALPRRLMLDFRDTFQEGLSFDDLQGKLQIRKGSIFSDNVTINSPVTEIRIEGRTGLVARDFDQKITVIPRVGDTLPVAGGLLFGTQVGAIILFFEKLLGGQIEKASAQEYHVTGSWEDPLITKLGEADNAPANQTAADSNQ